MSLFNAVFFMGIGAFSEMKKKTEELVKKGKISHEEAQRMFEDLNEGELLRDHLNPLSLSLGFSMYMKKRITELLEDLQAKGKITTEEAKRYYEKYIPEDIQKKKKKEEEKKKDFVKKEDFDRILKKLESIEKNLNR